MALCISLGEIRDLCYTGLCSLTYVLYHDFEKCSLVVWGRDRVLRSKLAKHYLYLASLEKRYVFKATNMESVARQSQSS